MKLEHKKMIRGFEAIGKLALFSGETGVLYRHPRTGAQLLISNSQAWRIVAGVAHLVGGAK